MGKEFIMWKDPEKSKKYWKERYREAKESALLKLGGKCIVCGSIENLEFDHINPETKTGNFTTLALIRDVGEKELDKCQLLCSSCHQDKTGRAVHGSPGMYRHQKCRCSLCRKANNKYHRERRRRIKLSG